MQTAELALLSIQDLAPLIRSREVSPRDLVRACLDRIDRYDGTLNSFITVLAEPALATAEAAEREIAAGAYRGPVHGVPVAVKDLLATAGVRTTSGSRIEADCVPDYDATVVERLREAGAILLGKLNLHEFACGPTSTSPHFGRVGNPWHPNRIAGGSSGGSGSAVKASLVTAAIGTDTGGSIRIPAALCGIAGLKPTYGWVSRFGVTALAWSLDHVGPMTKTVEDAALMMNAIAGYDPRDPGSSDVPAPDFTQDLRLGARGLRIGVPRAFFFERLEPGVRSAVEEAMTVFERLGAELREVTIPDIEYAGIAQLAITMSESAAYHLDYIRQRAGDYAPDVRLRLESGRFVPAPRYLQALRARSYLIEMTRRTMADLDALMTPTVAVTAPEPGLTHLEVEGKREDIRTALTRLTSPFNLVGLPALTVPCGFSDGLPVGLQIVGKPFAEATILRAGWAYEQATDWHRHEPPL